MFSSMKRNFENHKSTQSNKDEKMTWGDFLIIGSAFSSIFFLLIGMALLYDYTDDYTRRKESKFVLSNFEKRMLSSAKFQLQCENVKIEILHHDSNWAIGTRIGVVGCDKRIIYVYRKDGWQKEF